MGQQIRFEIGAENKPARTISVGYNPGGSRRLQTIRSLIFSYCKVTLITWFCVPRFKFRVEAGLSISNYTAYNPGSSPRRSGEAWIETRWIQSGWHLAPGSPRRSGEA